MLVETQDAFLKSKNECATKVTRLSSLGTFKNRLNIEIFASLLNLTNYGHWCLWVVTIRFVLNCQIMSRLIKKYYYYYYYRIHQWELLVFIALFLVNYQILNLIKLMFRLLSILISVNNPYMPFHFFKVNYCTILQERYSACYV